MARLLLFEVIRGAGKALAGNPLATAHDGSAEEVLDAARRVDANAGKAALKCGHRQHIATHDGHAGRVVEEDCVVVGHFGGG